MTPRGRLALAVLLVLAAALAPRLGQLAALRSSWQGTHHLATARGDAGYHWQEARELIERGFRPLDRVPWKAPGYSYFLAALMLVFGDSPAALRWPLAVLGAMNCAGLVLLARRSRAPRGGVGGRRRAGRKRGVGV
jgi:hypothetical protein